MANKIGAQIELSGEKEYRKQLQYIATETKKFASEVKNISSSFDSENKSIKQNNQLKQAYQKQLDSLNKALEVQKKRLAETQEAFNQTGVITESQTKLLNRYQTEVNNTEAQINKLSSTLKSLPSSFDIVGQKLKDVGEKTKSFGDSVAGIGKKLTTSISAPLAGLATIGINYNAQMEQYKIMLTTLTGSANEADKIITQLQSDASKSPFNTDKLIKANQYLLSTGESAEEARNMINYLGNAISATGGGNAELDRMAVNLQQIKNLGKASSMDIKQFAMAGIDIYGLLADSMGVTTVEAKEMDVTYEQLYAAFEKASSEGGKYFGAMEGQSQSLNGQISNLKDNVSQMLGELTSSLMPTIKDIVSMFKDWVDRIKNLTPQQQKLIADIAKFLIVVGPAVAIVGKIISGIGTFITSIGAITSAMGTLAPVFAAIKAGLVAISGALGLSVGWFVAIAAAVVAAGVLIIKNWDSIKEGAAALWETITQTVQDIADGFVKLKDDVVKSATEMINNVINFFTQLKDKAVNLFNTLKTNVVSKVTEIKNNIVNSFTQAKNNAINLFTNLKDSAINIFNNLKAGIGNVVGNIKTTIVNGISGAVNWIKGLGSEARSWGRDMINGFVNGIKSAIGAVGDAVSSVAGKVRSFLHFSEPDVGPLSDFSTYMPDMMKLMAKGINDNAYRVEDALDNVTGSMADRVQNTNAGGIDYNYGGVVINLNVPEGANGRMLVDEIEAELANRTIRRKAVF